MLNDSLNDPELVRRQCEELITSANFEAVDSIRHACVEQFLKHADPTVVYDPHFWIHQAAQVGSGFMYHAPCLKNAHFFQKTGSPVYLFSFDHELENGNSFYQAARSFHNLDLLFLENFLFDIFNHTFTAKDQYVRNLVGDLLTNFAKYGMPTPRLDVGVYWQQLHRPRGYNYLSISYPAQMMSYFNVDSTKFWIDSVPLLENAVKASAAAKGSNKLKTG